MPDCIEASAPRTSLGYQNLIGIPASRSVASRWEVAVRPFGNGGRVAAARSGFSSGLAAVAGTLVGHLAGSVLTGCIMAPLAGPRRRREKSDHREREAEMPSEILDGWSLEEQSAAYYRAAAARARGLRAGATTPRLKNYLGEIIARCEQLAGEAQGKFTYSEQDFSPSGQNR
jgi:hypothetical protein